MNKNKIIKISIISLATLLILSVLGLSYAYFSLLVKGKSNNMITKMGSLRLKYVDNDVITLNNAFPGDSVTKTVTVTNIGTLTASYNLSWEELQNGFINDELVIEAKCTRLNSEGVEEGTCKDLSSIPVESGKILPNIKIEPDVTHKYEIKITFIDTGNNQNYNKNADFGGKIGLTEGADDTPVYCNFDGEIVTGATFVKGPYIYKYNQILTSSILPQKSNYTDNIPATFMNTNTIDQYSIMKIKRNYGVRYGYVDAELNGWSVALADKTSTDPVVGEICTYINDIPIVSMSNMFSYSDAESIDLDHINTSNVTDMSWMFAGVLVPELDLRNLDTGNVKDMHGMFARSDTVRINLDDINTSNVIDMSDMFYASSATKVVGIDKFNTSNVIDMGGMFFYSSITSVNFKNFNTGNVTNMESMFGRSKITLLDLSSFNTSKVTDMSNMFYHSEATEIKGLNGFDTSNVTNMESMFGGVNVDKLDVSSFNTNNVIDMNHMFSWADVTEIKGLEKFNTSNVTDMSYMFDGDSFVSILDLSSFDTSKVTDMSSMFSSCNQLVTIYASDKFVTTLLPDDITIFGYNNKLVGGAGTVYNYRNSDKEYARIDTESTPGYFTLKTA